MTTPTQDQWRAALTALGYIAYSGPFEMDGQWAYETRKGFAVLIPTDLASLLERCVIAGVEVHIGTHWGSEVFLANVWPKGDDNRAYQCCADDRNPLTALVLALAAMQEAKVK